MMKHLIVFCGLMIFGLGASSHVFAQKSDGANPVKIMTAFKDYCVGALKANIEVAEYAVQQKLAELPLENSKKFSPDGGRVFALPLLNDAGVLTTNPNFKSVCGIAIHKTNKGALQKQIFDYFASAQGFRLLKEKRNEMERVTRTEFSGDIGGPVKVLISSSDSPRPNGIQVLMTIGRVTE